MGGLDPNVMVALGLAMAPTIAIAFSTILNYFTAKQARLATERVAVVAAAASKENSRKLDDITDTTHIIHTIVNSQHTKLLQLVANLAKRIAEENPNDASAQEDAKEAAAGVSGILRGVEERPPVNEGTLTGTIKVDLKKDI
jgi:hypothetical protein